MKFLQVFSSRPPAPRPEVVLTVAEGFKEDTDSRIPRVRLCESLRERLNVVSGSLITLSTHDRRLNCRVGVSVREDEGRNLIRLNPRARVLLAVALGGQVRALINSTPISSSAVPLEVAPAMKDDQHDAEPVVRLGRTMRDHLGLESGDYVNIKSGEAQLPARVAVGAKGDRAVARLNPMARGMLQVAVGDLVEVVPYETLVLLIDASGSMDEQLGFLVSKMSATREAIDRLLTSKQRAKEHDLVGLVTFGEDCDLVAEPSDDFDHLRKKVAAIDTCGRTAMFEGLSYTLEVLQDAGGLRRAILLSDGCPTTTGSGLVLELALKAKALGVVIDTIGVGLEKGRRKISYDEALLRRIAEITGGHFTPVQQVKALEEEFALLADSKKIPLLTAGGGQ